MAKFVLFMLAACLIAMPAVAAEGDAAAGPQWFIVQLRHHDAGITDAAMGAAMQGHIEYMNGLYDDGILYMAGPYTDDSGLGAGVVMAGSADQVRASLEQDPGYKAGVFTIEAIHPWMPLFNRPMNQRMTVADFQAMMAGDSASAKPMPVEPDGGIGTTPPPAAGAGGEAGMMDSKPGRVGFTEFGATDLAGMKQFYGTVFGWTIDAMPGMDTMMFWTDPGGNMGGFSTEMAPSADGPVCYLDCEGIAAMLAKIESAGGKTAMPGMQLPGGAWGYIAQFIDPQGNKLGLWSMAP
jgi:predicted enzyme related to lactoylglutathione lyase/uncharacterized protein YciI